MASKIYAKKTDNREDFTRNILERYSHEFRGKKVFVKPNIVSLEPYPTTTHPAVLKTLVEILLDHDCKVSVGDGPAPTSGRSSSIIKNHSLNSICSNFGIELLNLHTIGFEKIKIGNTLLKISKILLDAEYLISLPVLKSHQYCGMTGALKNQFGLLSNKERIFLHSPLKNLHSGIAKLNKAVRMNLFIVDAVETLIKANERRHGGIQTCLGYMMGGTDPVALDCFGLEILATIDEKLSRKSIEDIEHINYALQLKLGNSNYEIIQT